MSARRPEVGVSTFHMHVAPGEIVEQMAVLNCEPYFAHVHACTSTGRGQARAKELLQRVGKRRPSCPESVAVAASGPVFKSWTSCTITEVLTTARKERKRLSHKDFQHHLRCHLPEPRPTRVAARSLTEFFRRQVVEAAIAECTCGTSTCCLCYKCLSPLLLPMRILRTGGSGPPNSIVNR
eukprot:622211-Amphidinium_carterae.2